MSGKRVSEMTDAEVRALAGADPGPVPQAAIAAGVDAILGLYPGSTDVPELERDVRAIIEAAWPHLCQLCHEPDRDDFRRQLSKAWRDGHVAGREDEASGAYLS